MSKLIRAHDGHGNEGTVHLVVQQVTAVALDDQRAARHCEWKLRVKNLKGKQVLFMTAIVFDLLVCDICS